MSETEELAAPEVQPPEAHGVKRARWLPSLLRGCYLLLLVGVLASVLAGSILYLETRVYAPVGSIGEEAANHAKWDAMLPGLPLLLVNLVAPVAVPLLLLLGALLSLSIRRFRTLGVALIFASFALCEVSLIWEGAMMAHRAIFRKAFTNTAERAQPLIDAIEAYKKARGEYPPDLLSLVPDFLSAVPNTGLAGYPEFEYRLADESDEFCKDYELLIETPSGGINFDVFVYWPQGGYPDYFYGGGPEMFGAWAYVHE